MSQLIRKQIPPQYYAKHFSTITFKTSFGNCVYKALLARKWKEVEDATWTLQWCQKQRVNDVFENGITNNQRVNHFRLYTQLCRKDMLMKNIRKHKRLLAKQGKLVESQWNFMPLTFFLPSQYIMFCQEFKKQGGLWIMKPTARCQGSGIFLVDKLAQVAPYRFKTSITDQNSQNNTQMSKKISKKQKQPIVSSNKKINGPQRQKAKQLQRERQKQRQKQEESDDEQDENEQNQQQNSQPQTYIIQQYISKPLLFGGKKFDLRIYAFCTNYSQLNVYLYRIGFARFTHEPYNCDDIFNLESHLTNVQIQKHSQNYDQVRGGKWIIDKLKHFLYSRYNPNKVDQCFTQIKDIILRSLQAVQKNILVSKSSFQLYGYDFMIDAALKPWLIQVNGGPSMTANTDFDCKLKCGLIDDVLTIVDLQGLTTGQQHCVGGFDIISKKGTKVYQSKYSDYQTTLGWKNQRVKVYKKLIKDIMLRKKQQKQQSFQIQKQNRKNQKIVQKNGQKKNTKLPNFYNQVNRHKNNDFQSDQNSLRGLKQELRLIQQLDQKNQRFMPWKGETQIFQTN